MAKITQVSLDDPPIIQTSEQAVPIAKVFGRARVSGQIIWADEFKIIEPNKKNAQVGMGFSLSFAIALCEGEINLVSKIWANNKLLDLQAINWRFYKGSSDQAADPLIEAALGIGNAPAFRDVAYVIFEDLPLIDFGNMVPQFGFEVVNAIGDLERDLESVAIIPGATEFGYHTVSILKVNNFEYNAENQHGFTGETDFLASIDELCHLCPKLKQVSLVVPWFGNDLRASEINIQPCVDDSLKITTPESWFVNGLERIDAVQVSYIDGRAAYGGTPSDASVLAAIAEFKRRNIKVVFYPFILMDIAADNILPNPYGGVGQAVYPWRGRITCHPAIGQVASPDKTSAATSQVSNFFGNCKPNDIKLFGQTVFYSGAPDLGYRRMILHYAKLCNLAGGVDAFLIGSELVALTKIRDSADNFPAVAELVALAADVKQIIPNTLISYAADWSEYFGYQPNDGSKDVFFHLDDLWSNINIDFIGIDAYWPLSDWRDDREHIDKAGDVRQIYNPAYLYDNIRGGEGFDFYYASQADREAQLRSPITDGVNDKAWVFKYKDIKSWWQNQHYNRINDIEFTEPTAWVAESKPIWLTEIGCPAVDKGANQPNVFYDPTSSESKLPYFAKNQRDDFIQRRYLEALVKFYSEETDNNPLSSQYLGRMINVSNLFIWVYDARPYPLFPLLTDVWADGLNWNYGHWLNGRLGAAPLDKLILQFTLDIKTDVSAIYGQIEGYIVDELRSPYENLNLLIENFGLIAFIRDDTLIFQHLQNDQFHWIDHQQVTELNPPAIKMLNKLEIPTDMHLKYISDQGDYTLRATSELQDLNLNEPSRRLDILNKLPAILSKSLAAKLTKERLYRTRDAAEKIKLSIGAETAYLECGDIFGLKADYPNVKADKKWRVTEIDKHNEQLLFAEQVNIASGSANGIVIEQEEKLGVFQAKTPIGAPLLIAFNLPNLGYHEDQNHIKIAAWVKPWQGNIDIHQQIGDHYIKRLSVSQAAMIGSLTSDFGYGPVGRYDFANQLEVKLLGGKLSSISEIALLAGGNQAILQNSEGGWEILQFKNAELIGDKQYRLTQLIRGKFGSDKEMRATINSGARFIILDEKIAKFTIDDDEILSDILVKYGPSSRPIDDISYSQSMLKHQAINLLPFAVCHVKAFKNGDDILLEWVRQTRFGGENWALNQVALNDAPEQYEVEIWAVNGSEKLRLTSVTEPIVSYSATQQVEDFGGLSNYFKVKIYQISAQFGRGDEKEVIINV